MKLSDMSITQLDCIDALRLSGSLTKAQLAHHTGLSLSRASHIARELVSNGFVQDLGPTLQTRGRKASLIQIRPEVAYAVGIDLGSEFVRVVLVDFAGSTTSRHEESMPFHGDPAAVIDGVASKASEMMRTQHMTRQEVVGVGVAATGIIDPASGTCLTMPVLAKSWTNIPVVEGIRSKLRIERVFLEDSPRAMAISEMAFGAARGLNDFVLVNIGHSMGSGIVVNGKVLRGTGGIAGELGHIRIADPITRMEQSSVCCCGNIGCLESVASGWAMKKQAADAVQQGVNSSLSSTKGNDAKITIQRIIEAAQHDDKYACNLISGAGRVIGIAISFLINLLGPQRVIVGGGLAQGAGDLLLNPIIDSARSQALPWIRSGIDIRLSELDSYSAAIGSALIAFERWIGELRKNARKRYLNQGSDHVAFSSRPDVELT